MTVFKLLLKIVVAPVKMCIRDRSQGLDAPQVPRPMVKAKLPEPQF